jgi:hypothetical protein
MRSSHSSQLELPIVGPIGAAVAVDAISHSIPGLNILLALLSEPFGAAAGEGPCSRLRTARDTFG